MLGILSLPHVFTNNRSHVAASTSSSSSTTRPNGLQNQSSPVAKATKAANAGKPKAGAQGAASVPTTVCNDNPAPGTASPSKAALARGRAKAAKEAQLVAAAAIVPETEGAKEQNVASASSAAQPKHVHTKENVALIAHAQDKPTKTHAQVPEPTSVQPGAAVANPVGSPVQSSHVEAPETNSSSSESDNSGDSDGESDSDSSGSSSSSDSDSSSESGDDADGADQPDGSAGGIMDVDPPASAVRGDIETQMLTQVSQGDAQEEDEEDDRFNAESYLRGAIASPNGGVQMSNTQVDAIMGTGTASDAVDGSGYESDSNTSSSDSDSSSSDGSSSDSDSSSSSSDSDGEGSDAAGRLTLPTAPATVAKTPSALTVS
jgi:hypothetical protein